LRKTFEQNMLLSRKRLAMIEKNRFAPLAQRWSGSTSLDIVHQKSFGLENSFWRSETKDRSFRRV
jgi:hypothetical protein